MKLSKPLLAGAVALALSSLAIASTSPAASAPAAPLPGPGVSAFALDRTDARPVAAATRLVVFRYSDQVSFTIRSLPAAFTNVEVPAGEEIEGFYLSDPASWSFHVTDDKARVLIRPAAPGAYTTGTMVTSKRSYELTLIAVNPGEPWFQRVRWDVAAEGSAATGIFTASSEAEAGEGAAQGAASLSIPPEKLNFAYEVRGRAPFAPTAVFDDGVRTWFRLGPSQDQPAIFAITEGGVDVVDVARRGEYAVVPRLSDEWLIKLHDKDVKVRRRGR